MLSYTSTHPSFRTGDADHGLKATNHSDHTATGWNEAMLTMQDVLTVIVVYLVLASVVAGASILFELFVKLP